MVQPDGVAERWKKAPGVELDALRLLEPARARKESLKLVGVVRHGARAPAFGELEHGRGTEGRPEPQVEEILEVAPVRRAVIRLQLDEPELRDVVQMVRRHEHALVDRGAMLAEIGLALIDEEHRISGAVEAGKIPLLVFRVKLLLARPELTVAIGAP